MYKLKQIPEDFKVTEVADHEVQNSGNYLLFKLRKREYNTISAIQKIAQYLRVPAKNIGFAGAKDRAAVTEQYCTVKGVSKSHLAQFENKDINVEVLGMLKSPISLGDLQGNKFEITVRNLKPFSYEVEDVYAMSNLFGPQRFSKNNKEVGKLLLKKRWKEAAEAMDNEAVQEYLKKNPTDAIGAIKELPRRILMIYVHAYQSYLWNETVRRFLAENPSEEMKVPLVGFHTDLDQYDPRIADIIRCLLVEESIKNKDFICKQIPYLSLEGDEREMFVEIGDLQVSPAAKDELNEGMLKIRLKFFLPKGSYATEAIAQLLSIS